MTALATITLETTTLETPIGPIGLAAHVAEQGGALVGVSLGRPLIGSRTQACLERALGPHALVDAPDPAGAAGRLRRFFDGDLGALAEQPVALHGTEFQRAVWEQLTRIPPGTTWTYRRLAESIGRPTAVRAVGAANGFNFVALFVPCHRVIASDGTLWGYGGGLPAKEWLLRHEGALPPDLLTPLN